MRFILAAGRYSAGALLGGIALVAGCLFTGTDLRYSGTFVAAADYLQLLANFRLLILSLFWLMPHLKGNRLRFVAAPLAMLIAEVSLQLVASALLRAAAHAAQQSHVTHNQPLLVASLLCIAGFNKVVLDVPEPARVNESS